MTRIPSIFTLLLFSLLCESPVAADSRGIRRDNGNGHNGNDDASPTSSSSSSLSTGAASAANSISGSQGDRQCPGSQLMCVTGTVNGSTVTYELQSTGSQSLGWMAIGFGSQMANTPMVIMWPNSDGTITLSQREAPAEVMPTPVASPTKVATAATSLSTLSGSQPVLAFTIAGSAQQQPLIWAFGTTRPAAGASSTLNQHLDSGTVTLDLTKTLSTSNSTSTIPSGSSHIPFLPYEKTIVAHAVITTFGFLFALPAGVLLARYTRTISTRWFTGHWLIQVVIAGPFIVAGVALGFQAVKQQGSQSVTSMHRNIGPALLGLYIAQCFLGAFIHYVKIPFRFGRPPQNYVHALLGLATIILALYQVYLGFHQEWPFSTGRGAVSHTVTIVWIVWCAALGVLYFGGLAYLPRQLRQEKPPRKRADSEELQEYGMVSYSDSQEKFMAREQSHVQGHTIP